MRKTGWFAPLLAAAALTAALTACGSTSSAPASSAAGAETPPASSASGTEAPSASTPDAAEAYGPVLERYRTALAEQWDLGMLYEAGMGDIMADCGPDIGYALEDLDGDGRPELLIATTAAEDDFYAKLALALYTLDDAGAPKEVFTSIARSRYYTLGGGQFGYFGSNGADDSVAVTMTYAGGALTESGGAADPAAFVQWELCSF